MKQLILSKELSRQVEFGGDLLKGKRKISRPFSRKHAMHITFRRSERYASVSLLSKQGILQETIGTVARKHRVHLYDFSINSNHLHFLMRSLTRQGFQNFLRECSIKIVRLMTGARKGKALPSCFWKSRPWSRIVEWGRAFVIAKDYVYRNRLEAAGTIVYDRSIKTSAILRATQC